jgi:protease IV
MKQKIKKGLPVAFLIIVILTIGMFWYDQINYYLYYSSDSEYDEVGCWEEDNVALIKVQGEIVTYENWYGSEEGYEEDIVSSEVIVEYIQDAEERDHIEAIIIEIDSHGGFAVAGEEIMKAIKRSKKPTVAVIREQGASAGYLVATGADYIFASEMSDVGSIAITMSYLDYSEKNRKEGIVYQELSSGKFKNTGNPDKDLTKEERELLMRDVIELHDIFVRYVAENRGMEIKEVEKLADGSSMLGERAKEIGLIDGIGDVYSAKRWISKKLNIYPEICVY